MPNIVLDDNLDMSNHLVLNLRVQNKSVALTNPFTGSIYYDTTLQALRVWTGTEWLTATGGLDSPIITGIVTFNAIYDNGNSGTTKTIDWANGNKQKVTLTGNCTFTFTDPVGPASLNFILTQGSGGSHTMTWPANVKWTEGTAPDASSDTAGKKRIVTMLYDDVADEYAAQSTSAY